MSSTEYFVQPLMLSRASSCSKHRCASVKAEPALYVAAAMAGRGTHARQRWCFYNVRVPHPEQSWIETIRLAGEELDEAVRASVGNALDSMIAARP